VIWTLSALEDVEEIVDFIGRDSPSYAESFAESVFHAAGILDAFPRQGRMVPETGIPNVREILIHSYRILYEIHHDTVNILAVIHSRRGASAVRNKIDETIESGEAKRSE
jgi:toxin ParE1/3/4